MAQLVAHHTGSVGVRGSNPLSSTIIPGQTTWDFLLLGPRCPQGDPKGTLIRATPKYAGPARSSPCRWARGHRRTRWGPYRVAVVPCPGSTPRVRHRLVARPEPAMLANVFTSARSYSMPSDLCCSTGMAPVVCLHVSLPGAMHAVANPANSLAGNLSTWQPCVCNDLPRGAVSVDRKGRLHSWSGMIVVRCQRVCGGHRR